MSQDPIVQALQNYTSCDVADALLKLNHPHGGFLADITMWSPKRQEGPTKIIGPAYTVKYVRKDNSTAPKFQGHYIDTIPPYTIIFITAPTHLNALYGGLMTTLAKRSHAIGTIVDGRVRDLQEHRQLDYPVFARDVGTTSPQETLRVSEVDVPVRLQSEEQDVVVCPGDYLIGDLNGVVCLPRGLAGRAVGLLEGLVGADERVRRDLEGGRGFAESCKEHRG